MRQRKFLYRDMRSLKWFNRKIRCFSFFSLSVIYVDLFHLTYDFEKEKTLNDVQKNVTVWNERIMLLKDNREE